MPASMDRNREDLSLLGIFHYVLAALTMLCGGGYGAAMGLMAASMSSMARSTPSRGQPPPPEFFALFGGMGALVAFGALLYAAALIAAGICLRRQRHWLYCMIIAGVSCAWMPLGTVLGVFSLLVLLRPGARDLFSGAVPPAPPPAPLVR